MKTIYYSILLTIFLLLVSSCQPDSQKSSDAVKFADSILNEMTIEEKIGQLTLFTSGWDVTGPTLRDSYRDDILTGRCGNLFNAHTVKYNRELQEMAVNQTRLGIPLLFGYDVIHGHRTIFPIPLAESCSWDSVLVEKSAQLSALEASASGLNWTFNPMVDISRDPRWGRVAEGSGEDVFLGSIFARAKVRGYQGNDLSEKETIAACVKHFAGYGAPQAGRDYNTVDMSERVFLEDYLPPYAAAVNAGVATVMTSFNEIFGIPATANQYLLKDILRDRLGFKGMVVTDYTSINEMVQHGYATDVKHAAELALNAGVDMDMQGAAYYDYLETLLKEGRVKMEDVDQAVRNVLVLKYELGLFEDPFRYLDEEREKEIVLSESLLEHSVFAAERSMVLLKNESFRGERLLPIISPPSSIAVIGPMSTDKINLLGSWHASGTTEKMKNLEDALKSGFPSSRIKAAAGCSFYPGDRSGFNEALNLAKSSELVILAIGENFMQSGEAASRTDINLPGVQQELVEKIVATGKPVIAVIFAGRPLTINWISENIPAVLYAWQPGTMAAEAVVNVLSGRYNPSGKLTLTFPRSVGQIPVHYDVKNTGRPAEGNNKFLSRYIDSPNTPLFPFGYGLSFTTFEYSDPVLSDSMMDKNGSITCSVSIKNTGEYAGEEIVQLYIRDLVGSVTRPVLELKGFEKTMIEPGGEKTIQFTITEKDLRFYDSDLNYISEPGDFMLFVGPNSGDLKAVNFRLVGS